MRQIEGERDREAASPEDHSRREFVALSAAVGLAAVTRAGAADLAVVESEVQIKTADGVCDAALFHPATGSYPGVLVWTDAFGLRPTFRELGRRLAGQGYAVLVPNPFYRVAKAPIYNDASVVDFGNPDDRAKLMQLMGTVTAAGAAESDCRPYLEFLRAQSSTSKAKKMGVQGYCMGGPLTVRTAATAPDLVGAGASFHGGGLVTDKPTSPHLLAPKIKARMYFAIAASDDTKQPEAKDELRKAFAAAQVPAEIEVYAGTQHGWCVADMRPGATPVYSQADAERAWGKLLGLYREALA